MTQPVNSVNPADHQELALAIHGAEGAAVALRNITTDVTAALRNHEPLTFTQYEALQRVSATAWGVVALLARLDHVRIRAEILPREVLGAECEGTRADLTGRPVPPTGAAATAPVQTEAVRKWYADHATAPGTVGSARMDGDSAQA